MIMSAEFDSNNLLVVKSTEKLLEDYNYIEEWDVYFGSVPLEFVELDGLYQYRGPVECYDALDKATIGEIRSFVGPKIDANYEQTGLAIVDKSIKVMYPVSEEFLKKLNMDPNSTSMYSYFKMTDDAEGVPVSFSISGEICKNTDFGYYYTSIYGLFNMKGESEEEDAKCLPFFDPVYDSENRMVFLAYARSRGCLFMRKFPEDDYIIFANKIEDFFTPFNDANDIGEIGVGPYE